MCHDKEPSGLCHGTSFMFLDNIQEGVDSKIIYNLQGHRETIFSLYDRYM